MTKTKPKRWVRKGDGVDSFLKDKKSGDYEKPGPVPDSDADYFSRIISKIKGRQATGFVMNWLPPWAKKNAIPAFSFYFYQEKLALDCFNRNGGEMDALADDFTQEQQAQITKKTALCSENGISYMVLGPDDEADETQIAAKIGRTTFKKGSKTLSGGRAGLPSGDGIDEEGE